SVYWTGPLEVLLTIAGAGAVGLSKLREGGTSARARVKESEALLEASRESAARHRERAKKLRRTADRRSRRERRTAEKAADQRAAANTRVAESTAVKAALEAAKPAVVAKAKLERLKGHHEAVPPAAPSPLRRYASELFAGVVPATAAAGVTMVG